MSASDASPDPSPDPSNDPPTASEKNVLRLAWTSLLNDLGSEVLIRLIPFYVTGVLGASMSSVGIIEGIAESTATLLKPVFGRVSDRLSKRKAFVTWGYALSAAARPMLALAGSWPEVAFLRFCDRLGKGVRTAPRDALIADSTRSSSSTGRSFGLNRALDTVGALVGVAAFGAWIWARGEGGLTRATWTRLTIACAVPGVLSVALVAAGISDIPRNPALQPSAPGAEPHRAARLDPRLRRYLLVVALFSLANSSDAFILLRAKELGFSLPQILGMVALLNVVSALTAIPAAALSDRVGRRALIASGWAIYALSYALIGSSVGASSPWAFAAVAAVYGLFFGFTESVEKAWIADLAPPSERGRAYGLFGFIVGAAALPASAVFGWAWDRWGSEVPFLACSALALFSTALLFALLPPSRPAREGV